MDARRLRLRALAVLLVTLVAGVVVFQTGLLYQLAPPNPDGYDRVTVTAVDANGTRLATVETRVADTREKRYLGLSDTARLGPDEGMLFVHESPGSYGYVMRNMSFPLDIVFVDADQRVTTIHHAAVPPDGTADRTYRGTGKWVLEVPRGWTNRTGLDVGDRVVVPDEARNASG